MSTEETPVQMENDRAWTAPLPRRYIYDREPLELTTRLTNSSEHLQAPRRQLRKMWRAILLKTIAVVLWLGFGASLYLLFSVE